MGLILSSQTVIQCECSPSLALGLLLSIGKRLGWMICDTSCLDIQDASLSRSQPLGK